MNHLHMLSDTTPVERQSSPEGQENFNPPIQCVFKSSVEAFKQDPIHSYVRICNVLSGTEKD